MKATTPAMRSPNGVSRRRRSADRADKPPHLYRTREVPRVDVHTHMRDQQATGRLIRVMDQAGVTISINLSPSREMIADADATHRKWRGRILLAPGTYWIDRGLWWSKEDLVAFRQAGCVGTKILSKYQRGLTRRDITTRIRQQTQVGPPVLWVHVVDPPQGRYWQPGYWDCIRDAEKLVGDHPRMTVIMAPTGTRIAFWKRATETCAGSSAAISPTRTYAGWGLLGRPLTASTTGTRPD